MDANFVFLKNISKTYAKKHLFCHLFHKKVTSYVNFTFWCVVNGSGGCRLCYFKRELNNQEFNSLVPFMFRAGDVLVTEMIRGWTFFFLERG